MASPSPATPATPGTSAAAASQNHGHSHALPRATLPFCPIPDSSKAPKSFLLAPVTHSDASHAPIGVGHFRGRHLLSVDDVSRAEIERLLQVADYMASVVAGPGSVDLAKGCILAALFYEPSTRTSASFQAAMLRLGGQVLPLTDVSSSSVAKGETLEDSVRCLQCYSNIIALRHPEKGAAARAAKVLGIPLINAGDGIGEHPTQALLDLYTMHGELGRVDGLVVTMVGDLKNGRTVHSLSKLLTHFACQLRFVSPESLRMPQPLLDTLTERGAKFTQHSSLDDVLKDTDVLYVTRVQKERFSSAEEYEQVKDAFVITPALLTRLGARDTLRILHPLPRVNELAPELDDDPRSAYFRQMKHGLHVRMAIIACLLGKA
jgi:aspartate carbamoyltransferase